MIWDGLREAAGVLVALAAVSLLAWGAIWLMKRLQLQGAAAAGAQGELRFVRALPLGPRERLVEVEWRGETLLLGVTAGGVSLLSREAGVAFAAGPAIGADPS
jgi:flagellar protein FliO/FliZ